MTSAPVPDAETINLSADSELRFEVELPDAKVYVEVKLVRNLVFAIQNFI